MWRKKERGPLGNCLKETIRILNMGHVTSVLRQIQVVILHWDCWFLNSKFGPHSNNKLSTQMWYDDSFVWKNFKSYVLPNQVTLIMLKYIFQIVTTLLITFIEVKSDKTLLSVNLLFRHGDRTPIRPYPNDPHKDPSNWPVGFGQLTTRGKQMHYKLGKFLRSRYGSHGQGSYKDFLGQKYKWVCIEVLVCKSFSLLNVLSII